MRNKNQSGFTLIEIIIVISVFTILFAVSTISLTGLIPEANFVSSYQSILSDIKNQQLKAMTGDTNGSGSGSAYGIYLEDDQYTLFKGLAYNPSSSDNVIVELPPGLNITEITFPFASLVFLQVNGEISNYDQLNSSFKLTNTSTSEEKIVNLNKLGVVLPN